ncbi:hypothetical protein [Pseudophaeobacter sp.]|uniref:hypothetical protein n=1 Tax=Pseudophaeobacter sp. TaxID=1971739 RepID=UPI00328DC16E
MTNSSFSHTSSSTTKVSHTHLTTAFAVLISTIALNGSENETQSEMRSSSINLFDVSSSSKAFNPAPSTGGVANQEGASSGSMTLSGPEVEWMTSSLDRIERLGSLPANWGGEGYQRATETAVGDAERFLTKLAHIGISTPPAIGLDDDGSFSFHIASGDLVADFSIHADGTYSYFAQRGQSEIFSDSTAIDGPIHDQLARILVT